MPSEDQSSDSDEAVGQLSGVTLFKDGRILRKAASEFYPKVASNASFIDGVATKDVMLSTEDQVWVRIYLPQPNSCTLAQYPSDTTRGAEDPCRMPILLFFHGGAFVIFSAATSVFDIACRKWARDIGAIVVSVGYRLAPEHRLPAAFDDAQTAVIWLRDQATSKIADPWLSIYGDFSSCFIMGISSGGCIAHHVTLRISAIDLSPLQIRGVILVVPFFGGVVRTSSELLHAQDDILTMNDADSAWYLALPPGATRDHPFSNPLGPHSPDLKKFDLPPYLLLVGGKDPLHDRQMEFAEALRKSGKDVDLIKYEHCGHCIHFTETDLLVFIERCISKSPDTKCF